jgi:hypothetical protein
MPGSGTAEALVEQPDVADDLAAQRHQVSPIISTSGAASTPSWNPQAPVEMPMIPQTF